jgi:hypothetical protein
VACFCPPDPFLLVLSGTIPESEVGTIPESIVAGVEYGTMVVNLTSRRWLWASEDGARARAVHLRLLWCELHEQVVVSAHSSASFSSRLRSEV